ncbi:nucleoside permease [Dokdonia sp. Hel_I_53]|uniref:nucleoside permease n=1 Tax=Dokdonia sp. Hel_I_53 TaxID=1566287 RepID=UPI001199303E|nr:nucleoside permease [Dokdonia sp. Hel_I_53]TVZ52756.1 nucleoside transporter [Dokdonia sp. Hel_I_53]
MKSTIRIQLSVMMFLEFFIWGAWFVTMGTFLAQAFSADGGQLAMAYETQSIGAIIAPFIIGLIADRYFSAQKILGVLHLIGAVLLYLAGTSQSFDSFYPYILIYMILYMPTLALVNSVAFRQMKDPAKDFALIRVLGTVGWIVAGLAIGFLAWESENLLQNTFLMAAVAAAILGLFSFTLPDTPPVVSKNEKVTVRDILGLDALGMLKDKRYLVFFIASILICIPLAFYYQHANQFLNEIGMEGAAGKMTFGQMSEIAFMLLLPIFLKKYGIKLTLLVGMLAWVVRYILFAYGDAGEGTWMLIFGIILHGICYDFFFVSGQIYTDYKAGEKFKSSAQGLITLATYGLGMLIGFRLAGKITDLNALADGGHSWEAIWTIPAIIAGGVFLFFLITFKNEKIEVKE